MQNTKSNQVSNDLPLKKESEDSRQCLQERLHTLLTRISKTIEILQTWPAEEKHSHSQTQKLIQSLHKIIEGIRQVEEKVKGVSDEDRKQTQTTGGEVMTLQEKLRQTAIPLDLLDMMDYGNTEYNPKKNADDVNNFQSSHFTGLNPDCFARGLLRESLRQIGNMNRRKAALKMLAVSIQNGINARDDSSAKRLKIE